MNEQEEKQQLKDTGWVKYNRSESEAFEEMIIKGRETGKWTEGTEWSTAERHVYDSLLEKANKLLQNGIAKNKEQAMSEAVKLQFAGRRYYQNKQHADYPAEN